MLSEIPSPRCSRRAIRRVTAHIEWSSSTITCPSWKIFAMKVNIISRGVPYPWKLAVLKASGAFTIKLINGTEAWPIKLSMTP